MTTSLLTPLKIRHQKWVVAALTCNKPLIDPCGFCMSAPLLCVPLSHFSPLPEQRGSLEIRSSLSEVLCHVAQGAWNSPRAVEQTQAQGLSIAAPQTNCLSNEAPSLSWPHTREHAAMCGAVTFILTQHSQFDSKTSDTLLEEKTHEWHFSVCFLFLQSLLACVVQSL